MPADPLDTALSLLSDCNRAVREARFDALPPLVTGVESALSGLRRSKADPTRLALLRQRLAENRTLLVAAEQGIRIGRRRIDEVLRATRTLGTYDSQGRRVDAPFRDGVERKA